MLRWIILFIILFIIVQILIDSQMSSSWNSTSGTDYDKQHMSTYNTLIGLKLNQNSLDYYRQGQLYDYVDHNPDRASQCYKKALEKIAKQNKYEPIDIWIKHKIIDRVQLNNKYLLPEVKEAPLPPQAIMEIKQIIKETPVADAKPTWVSDPQNVHDSNINKEIIEQYSKIKSKVPHCQWNIETIKDYIKQPDSIGKVESKHLPKAIDALNYIATRTHPLPLGEQEPQFVGRVFTYIMQKDPETRRKLVENLVENLADMTPINGNFVCVDGRTSRVMAALAGVDELGAFKSKQVLRNEILARVGAVRNKVLEENPDVAKKYNEGIEDEDTSSIKKKIIEILDKEVLSADDTAIRQEIIQNL